MSKAPGAKKSSERQRAKLCAKEAAKDRREDFNHPARKDNIFGKKSDSAKSC